MRKYNVTCNLNCTIKYEYTFVQSFFMWTNKTLKIHQTKLATMFTVRLASSISKDLPFARVNKTYMINCFDDLSPGQNIFLLTPALHDNLTTCTMYIFQVWFDL